VPQLALSRFRLGSFKSEFHSLRLIVSPMTVSLEQISLEGLLNGDSGDLTFSSPS